MAQEPPAGRRRSPGFTAVLTLIGLFLLYLAVPSVGPAVRAARADGIPGTFTATRLDCVEHPGHEACTWSGDFRSDDGTVLRAGVALYGADRDYLRTGQRTRAVDVGRPSRVYGPGGSMEWVFTALLLLAGLGLLAFLYVRPLLRLAAARPRASAPVSGPHPGAEARSR
ncbi:hypothetical protein GCM10009530_60510 [Microbispora corallina]|uniref:DUF3592 domain-containing protein n=1 Tax=Microbispora corallina TaxID=83302 RepID=A0ABQ4FZ01_9ACTN|nr:hypothetical protein [Microbispora corallina]GIH40037.1 hypothetical protein Mco01_30370 [Microbispora corallina]